MTSENKGKSWIPAMTTAALDERVDNAMRRVSGSVGLDIAFDKGRMRTLKETAAQAMEAGLTSVGPWFMRVGQAAFDAGFCKIGSAIDLKEVGAEILYEFHTEAMAAFQAQRTALYTEAHAFLQGAGFDDEHVRTVLAAAEGAFMAPEKDAFTKTALPFVGHAVAPSTAAAFAGLAGGAGLFVLTRAPVLGILGAAAIGGIAYYIARTRQRNKAERLLRILPRNLYEMLATEWNSNIRRYSETVNTALAARGGGQ